MGKLTKIHCALLSLTMVFISGCSTSEVQYEELRQPPLNQAAVEPLIQPRAKLAHAMAESKVMASAVMDSEVMSREMADSER